MFLLLLKSLTDQQQCNNAQSQLTLQSVTLQRSRSSFSKKTVIVFGAKVFNLMSGGEGRGMKGLRRVG